MQASIWDIMSATGEWAGAIAVVASLLYLARQIRLANQQAKAGARYSFLNAYGLANAAIGESLDSAAVFRRGLEGDDLNPDERMQFIVLLGQFLNTWNVLHDLHSEGQLPPNQWHVVETDIYAAFTAPGGNEFWKDVGRANSPQTFIDCVEEILEREDIGLKLVDSGSAQG